MKTRIRNIAGILLVLVGLLIAIANLDFLGDQARSISAAILYSVFGGLFLYFRQQDAPLRWMTAAAIAAFGLAIIQVLGIIVLETPYVAPVSLIFLALSIILYGLMDLNRWWILIPAFLILALGAAELIELGNLDIPTSGGLYLGTGLAFLILYFAPERNYGKTNWALLPAVLLLAIGVLASYQDVTEVSGYLLPGLLLLAGVAVLVFTFRRSA